MPRENAAGVLTERTESKTRDPDFVEALARGLNVLACFGEARSDERQRRLTLTEVAELTGLSRGTARRLLLTLRALGYVASDGKLFWMTPKVLAFAGSYLTQLGLRDAARPIIKSVTDKLHESSSICVLDGADVIYVARVEVRRLYSSGIEIGTRLPAHCSSLGRVLLAGLDDEALDDWLAQHDLTSFTSKTVTDPTKWRRAIRAVRRQGYAIIDGELEIGIRSLAVPIAGADGRTLGALNVSTSTARVSQEKLLGTFLPELRAAADKLAPLMDW